MKLSKTKKAQEEMVGFALIIVLVAVILLIFIGFSLKNNSQSDVESYEVESFIQSSLQYTTDCHDNLEYLSMQKLIFSCNNKEKCLDGRDACDVLNSTLSQMVTQSWQVEAETPVKGYSMKITSNGRNLLGINKGNTTKNSKGAVQDFSQGGSLIEISFEAYY